MELRKIFSKRKTAIGLLAGVYFFTWVPNILADDDDDQIDPRKNIIAIHDSSSDEYKNKCSECHASIPQAQSLESSIAPAAHVAMFDFAPGKPGDDKQCIWCHRTVDLVQGSAGNLRKQVDATLCTLCHGAPPREVINNKEPERSATAKQFYQAGLSPTDPDGPALYDLACAACHRNPENSQVKGARTDQIQRAIEKDKGKMGPLTVLSIQEIQAIEDALAKPGEND
jgi:hypothetical protein